jgi:uncharacterized protein (DUF1499 family)
MDLTHPAGRSIAVAALLLISMSSISCAVSRDAPMGLVDGRLAPCPPTPNCVSSEAEPGPAAIEPLRFAGTPAAAWMALKRTVIAMGGQIEYADPSYLRAVFKTRVWRFTDDVDFRMVAEHRRIQVRSASRRGYSDLGVNRRRVEALRDRFAQEIAAREDGPQAAP